MELYDIFGDMEAGFAVFYGIYMLAVSGFGIAAYVLRSLGFYTIAKRRGINHPWMSWVPVLDLWVLGCISDQYRYVVKGQNAKKRKWLLGLNIALAVIYIVFFVFFGKVQSQSTFRGQNICQGSGFQGAQVFQFTDHG